MPLKISTVLNRSSFGSQRRKPSESYVSDFRSYRWRRYWPDTARQHTTSIQSLGRLQVLCAAFEGLWSLRLQLKARRDELVSFNRPGDDSLLSGLAKA